MPSRVLRTRLLHACAHSWAAAATSPVGRMQVLGFDLLNSGIFSVLAWVTAAAVLSLWGVIQVLGFDLLKSGIFSVLPWETMAVSANIGGWIADTLVSRGVSVTTVRKVMQTVRPARPCRPRKSLSGTRVLRDAWLPAV